MVSGYLDSIKRKGVFMKKLMFIAMLFFATSIFAVDLKILQDANLRESPHKDSNVITVLKYDSVVEGEISNEYPDWYEIKYNEKLGYIHKSLVQESIDNSTLLKGFVIIVVSIVLLIISMKIAVINRICTILLHLARMVLAIMCINSIGFVANLDYQLMAIIFGCFTGFLILYEIGSSAFDDTREETGNVLLNPVEGGAYKLTSEITGNSPIGNFINAIFWSGVLGGITGYILFCLKDAMFMAVIILAVIGLIRGVISFIRLITL